MKRVWPTGRAETGLETNPDKQKRAGGGVIRLVLLKATAGFRVERRRGLRKATAEVLLRTNVTRVCRTLVCAPAAAHILYAN